MSAESLKEARLADLDRWKATASHFDPPLGYLVTRCFDVIYYVVRDGIRNDSSVPYSLESLEREQQLAHGRDPKRNDPLHNLVHGLAEGLATMIHSIREDSGEERLEDSHGSHSAAASDHTLPYTDSSSSEERKGDHNMDWNMQTDAGQPPLFAHSLQERIKHEDEDDDCQILEADDVAAKDVAAATDSAPVLSPQETPPQGASDEMEENEDADEEVASEVDEEEEQQGGAFACDLCSRRFTTNRGLILHGFTHTGIVCSGCNRAMRDQVALEAHIRKVHQPAGQKRPTSSPMPSNHDHCVQRKKPSPPSSRPRTNGSFDCTKCDRSFPTAAGLMRHQRTHDLAICKHCERPITKVYLNVHVKTKHPEEWARQMGARDLVHDDSPHNEEAVEAVDVGNEAGDEDKGYHDCATCWMRFYSSVELVDHLQDSPGHVKKEYKQDGLF